MEGEKFCLAWRDFSTNTVASMQQLRTETELFDVTLACDDYEVEAHKVALASSSSVFKSIVARKNPQNPLIYLRGVKKEDLNYMIDYIYRGEVNVNQEHLQGFLGIANDFKLKGLSEFQMDETLNDTNAEHQIANVIKEDVNFLSDNLSEIATKVEVQDKRLPRKYAPRLKQEAEPQETYYPDQQPVEPEVQDIIHAKVLAKLNQNMDTADTVRSLVPSFSNTTAGFMKTIPPPPEIICSDKEIKQYDNLVLSRMVKKEKHWYCLDCGKEFMPRNKNCAFRHIDLNHMSKYKFICSYCDKSFTAKNNLIYHHRNCQEKQSQQKQQLS